MQQAITGGQWSFPSGIFYGGTYESWSRKTLTSILLEHTIGVPRIILLDFHTGLGPHGYAEPIIHQPQDNVAFGRTRDWVGAHAKSIVGDGSASAQVTGDGLTAISALLDKSVFGGVSLECSVRPIEEVGQALRADPWLHAYGDLDSALGQALTLTRSAMAALSRSIV